MEEPTKEKNPAPVRVEVSANGDEDQPLLSALSSESTVEADEAQCLEKFPSLPLMFRELVNQQKMGGPLALNLFFFYMIQIVTMAFLGHCGEKYLAAAALSMVACNAMGTLVIMGLCGATSTLASQAYGAQQIESATIIFQRTVAFLAAHMVPITALVLSMPALCRWMGQDEEVVKLVLPYLLISLPGLWLDTVDRPMNRMLIAQGITLPQMCISGIVLLMHLATNYVFFNVLGWSYLAAALAYTLTRLYYFFLQVGYIAWAGLGPHVWGKPSSKAFAQWGRFARLAYPACIMRVMESWCYSGMTVVAGILPNGATAVSAISLAFNIYGTLFMGFLGVAIAVGTRVGNHLGGRMPGSARLSAVTAVGVTPLIWVPMALLLTVPATQDWLVSLFVRDEDGSLRAALGRLLYIVAALELFDGLQTVMSGVVTGAGKQARGALINFIAFYVCAVPASLLLAFAVHWWVYGLYIGLSLGPVLQTGLYLKLINDIDWRLEAASAADAAATH